MSTTTDLCPVCGNELAFIAAEPDVGIPKAYFSCSDCEFSLDVDDLLAMREDDRETERQELNR